MELVPNACHREFPGNAVEVHAVSYSCLTSHMETIPRQRRSPCGDRGHSTVMFWALTRTLTFVRGSRVDATAALCMLVG